MKDGKTRYVYRARSVQLSATQKAAVMVDMIVKIQYAHHVQYALQESSDLMAVPIG